MAHEEIEPSVALADIKGELAALGAQIGPDSKVTQFPLPEPGQAVNVVVLQRVSAGPSQHCVHGYTYCIGCGELVYLGRKTCAAVLEDGVFPLCVQCAATRGLSTSNVAGHLDDADH